MSSSAMLNLMHWVTSQRLGAISIVFALGALPAVPITAIAMRLLAQWLHCYEQRFALAFILLAVVTIGCTALFFSILYREMYVEWHAETFSRIWVFQYIFTTAIAFYQFAAFGMRLYFPLGFAALVAFSLWLGIYHRHVDRCAGSAKPPSTSHKRQESQ